MAVSVIIEAGHLRRCADLFGKLAERAEKNNLDFTPESFKTLWRG